MCGLNKSLFFKVYKYKKADIKHTIKLIKKYNKRWSVSKRQDTEER
jgi:hypothetical protein